jgi:GTP-binding protein
MLNAICGEERAIVCDMSGTTRDAVDTKVTLPSGQQLTLIDTAGIRKRARVADSKDGAEQLSVDRAVRAVSRADVVVVVVDASEGVTQQVGAGGGVWRAGAGQWWLREGARRCLG